MRIRKPLFVIYLSLTCALTHAQQQPRLMLPVGHTSFISSASLSPDGKYIVTASFDNTARIWEVSTGKSLHQLEGHTGSVTSASFSPDGNYVVTASSIDYTARIWEVSSGKEIHNMQGHTSCSEIPVEAFSASFSSNGKYVITTSCDNTARIWEVSSGKELRKLHIPNQKKNKPITEEDGLNYSASFSPDGKYVVTVSFDNTARIWEVSSGKLLHSLIGHSKNIISASFSSDGKYIVTASVDMTTRIWNVSSGKELHNLKGHKDWVNSASFSFDGKYVVTASSDNTARIWEVSSGKLLNILLGHTDMVNSASFSLDGKYVVTASFDNTAMIWEVFSGKLLHKLLGHTDWVNSASFSSDGKYVVTMSTDDTVRIWDAASGKKQHKLQSHTHIISSASFSRDGKYVVNSYTDNTARMWDIFSCKELNKLQGHTRDIVSTSFSLDGKYLVTASWDSTARIWEVPSGKELHNLEGHTAWVLSASFSPDGKYVVTASWDNIARIWEASTGKFLHVLEVHINLITSSSYSPDGKFVVAASYDSTARIWEVSTGNSLHQLEGHTGIISSASFSPDGKYVVTASRDHTARIWEASTGKSLLQLKGHTDEVSSASFSPDGKYVVTASVDSTGRIWETSSGKSLHQLKGHTDEVSSASFSPDGKYVVTASYDGTIRKWDASSGNILYVLEGHGHYKFNLSSDGKKIITNGAEHTAIIWDFTTGKHLYTRLQLTNNDWLVYDEDYHFDGSEGAINYLYLTCGLEIIDLAQVKDSLWIPGLAGKKIRGEQLYINDRPAPRLSDLNICDLTPVVEELPKDDKENMVFQITPRNGGLGETEVYINGNLTYIFRPEQLIKNKNKEGRQVYLLYLSKDSIVPYLAGIKGAVNPVLVKSKIKGASIYSRGVTVEAVSEQDPDLPKLYAVFVGVNDYNNPQKEKSDLLYTNLDYAAKDAGDLSVMVQNAGQALFMDSCFIYRLTGKSDIEPTKDNLKRVLAEIGTKSKANDILYIFFAGHGDVIKTDQQKNEIRFMLQGADKRNKNTGGFGVEELTTWCNPQNIKAQKRVFVFDACHSGQFVNETMAYAQGSGRGDEEDIRIRQLSSLKDKNGMMILAASSDNESAYEDPGLNQGVLTYHLLQAVKEGRDSVLQINKWFESTLDLVKEYAVANKLKQNPETFGNGRFYIGSLNNSVRQSIGIGAPKPRVGNNVFIDATGKYPNLKRMVNDYFKQTGSRGNFISTTNNEKAYYAEGSVVMDNGKIKILFILYYADKPIAEQFTMVEKKELTESELVSKITKSMEASINEYIRKSKK